MGDTIKHFDGRYLGIRERDNWEYVTRTNASAVAIIVAVTQDEELVLVEQFRVPVNAFVIELPAGLVGDLDDPKESALAAAKRELREETGFKADRFAHLLTCPGSAGMSDGSLSFYLAEGLVRTGPGGGDASENIKVHIVPLANADEWLVQKMKDGRLVDPKTYSALYWLERRARGLEPMPL